MHGQRREEFKARRAQPEVIKALTTKAEKWKELTSALLAITSNCTDASAKDNRDGNTIDARYQKILEITGIMLVANPDPLYLYNRRREALLAASTSGSNLYIEGELNLTASCLQKNPKAYGAWLHRKWVVQSALRDSSSVDSASKLLSSEIDLTAQFLLLDERNFHCWNYRRFLVGCDMDMTATSVNNDTNFFFDGAWRNFWNPLSDEDISYIIGPQILLSNSKRTASNNTTKSSYLAATSKIIWREWDFTTEKIDQNFSNCSAYHYRSKLLPAVVNLSLQQSKEQKKLLPNSSGNNNNYDEEERIQTVLNIVETELERIHNAIFTEPDDQTSWWYFRFLLHAYLPSVLQSMNNKNVDNAALAVENLLETNAALLEELVESEGGGDDEAASSCKWAYIALQEIYKALERDAEQNACIQVLLQIDSDRSQRYQKLCK